MKKSLLLPILMWIMPFVQFSATAGDPVRGGQFVLAQVLTQDWVAENWINYQLRTNTYIEDTLLSEELIQQWIAGEWVNSDMTTFSYNQYGQPETILYSSWDIIMDQWIMYARGYNTYDPLTHLLEELVVQINDGFVWQNEFRYLYSYNVSGQISTIMMQAWVEPENQWDNRSLQTYTYDVDGLLSELLQQNWNGAQWANDQLRLYSYNGQGWLLIELVKDWMEFLWMNDQQYTMTYSPDGLLTAELLELWADNQWNDHQHWTNGYDMNGNLITRLERDWDDTGGWVNSMLETYEYYLVGTAENQPSAGRDELQIFPNPAGDIIYITVPEITGMLVVTDVLGRPVYVERLSSRSNAIQIEGWPAGTYIARYHSGNHLLTGRMVISR